MLEILLNILKTLATPSSFGKDWYGYASNQISHAALGLLSVWLVVYLSFRLGGDIPYKWQILCFLGFLAIFKELMFDRWSGFDTIEDLTFYVVYGVGGTLASFKQVEDFSSDTIFNIVSATPFLSAFAIHLFSGVMFRAYKSATN